MKLLACALVLATALLAAPSIEAVDVKEQQLADRVAALRTKRDMLQQVRSPPSPHSHLLSQRSRHSPRLQALVDGSKIRARLHQVAALGLLELNAGHGELPEMAMGPLWPPSIDVVEAHLQALAKDDRGSPALEPADELESGMWTFANAARLLGTVEVGSSASSASGTARQSLSAFKKGILSYASVMLRVNPPGHPVPLDPECAVGTARRLGRCHEEFLLCGSGRPSALRRHRVRSPSTGRGPSGKR